MADTVTPKLGLTKPEVGASNNTWGTKWNANADIIEQKVVRNTPQWTVTPGDDTVGSAAGHWILSRFGNDTLKIDEPMVVNRQTGEAYFIRMGAAIANFAASVMQVARFPFQGASPAGPPAGVNHVYVNASGNLVIQRPSGLIEYVGVPPGTIAWTGAYTADVGWALLNGQSLRIADNPIVYNRMGVNFGPGSPNDGNWFALPDLRGRVIAHPDGGAGRLSAAPYGFAANPVLSGVGGLEYADLTLSELPAHRHVMVLSESPHSHAIPSISTSGNQKPNGVGTAPLDTVTVNGTNTAAATTGAFVGSNDGGGANVTNSSGGGQSHRNVQPTIILNAQVKLG